MPKKKTPTKHKLYIQMYSIHGLIRFNDPELGRDTDTGGQIKYVLELAEHLSKQDHIEQVDLFTRKVEDKRVDASYGENIEKVNSKFRIVRIQCGGKKYIRKELLWPHIAEFIDKTIRFTKKQKKFPDVIHGHYADGGYAGMQLARIFGVPFVFTGHSLGRSKKAKLLGDGLKLEDIQKRFKIDHRIDIEEEIIHHADLIVTSTSQEKRQQYGQYDNGEPHQFAVIPPGVNLSTFYPYYHDSLPEFIRKEESVHARATVMDELSRFFIHPDRPLILALCRPAKKKNINGLIEAYGEDMELQAMANLAIFAGIRKDISMKDEDEKNVLTEMLLGMDRYDLYGKMAIPKKHNYHLEVPELYRIAAESRGVFVNVALTEPFGLTLIEASGCGLPIVATNDGGPKDIIANCQNGVLVNAKDKEEISKGIKKIICDESFWKKSSKAGIQNVQTHYTWKAHVEKYMKNLHTLFQEYNPVKIKTPFYFSIGKRLSQLDHFLFTDIDNTLLGDNSSLKTCIEKLKDVHDNLGFGLATGRTIDSVMKVIKENDIPTPDLIISSVGAEIYYGNPSFSDIGWKSHINNKWNPNKIRKALSEVPQLEMQEEDTQRDHKISYNLTDPSLLPKIHDLLSIHKCHYNLIYSHDQFLDILPYRASKGKAIKYLTYKWEIPSENVLVCGDSGNDEEMLRAGFLGVVVSNYNHELERLRGLRKVYFSSENNAGGILDGMRHYHFFQ